MPMAVAMAELPSHPEHFDLESETLSEKIEQRRRLRNFLDFTKWRKPREGQQKPCPCPDSNPEPEPDPNPTSDTPPQTPVRPGFGAWRFSRKGLVGIPRSTTFRRQEDEQRKNLTPVEQSIKERRDVSKVRQRAQSAVPAPPRKARRERSVPPDLRGSYPSIAGLIAPDASPQHAEQSQTPTPSAPPPLPQPLQEDPSAQLPEEPPTSEASYDDAIDEELAEELKRKWILNLSMHFRDKSPREKFFLTYAESSDRWRRVTVSCDYRDTPADSLEADLQRLHYQKDKSARIYESIRMSLPDIQFYDTVTNLKLETKDERLHVHVTEDVNEIIPYPPVHLINHLSCHQYKESELHFDQHMSGFVYKVGVGEHNWIKKEIPGPDSVDEFLYEVNALSELVDSKNVIQLKGLVVNEEKTMIKGLLLGYAEQGALVDILYDSKEGHIPRVPWVRRERWAKHIVQGLSNIHEAGFVQGDFTLSNIVIDGNDDAQIIDINRRGCPVGWESPEMVPLVESGQRLSMFIGVKSDLYQLGMVLWALAMEKDEPERQARPLTLENAKADVPDYYRDLTAICLSEKSTRRLAAKDLLALFQSPTVVSEFAQQDLSAPVNGIHTTEPSLEQFDGTSTHHSEGIDLKGESFRDRQLRYHQESVTKKARRARSWDSPSMFLSKRESSDEDMDFRGRRYSPARIRPMYIPLDVSPPLSMTRTATQPSKKALGQLSLTERSEDISAGRSGCGEAQIIPISPTGERGWEEINMDGTPYLIHRDTLDDFDEVENLDNVRRGKNKERWRWEIEHVDSGLADMELEALDSKERHLRDLAGVGGNENLIMDVGQHMIEDGKAHGITNDLGIEHNDGRNDTVRTPQGITNDLSIEHHDDKGTAGI